jgi:hypothetical protein
MAELSTSGGALTFIGHNSPINTLDVSNSNTPNHVDPTNPVAASYQRAIIQLNGDRQSYVTPVNTYSGNNGRAAILNDSYGADIYYTVGNAGNGSGTPPTLIVNNTGVQIAQPNIPDTTVVGVQQGTSGAAKGFQYGYSVTQYGYTADKSGRTTISAARRSSTRRFMSPKAAAAMALTPSFKCAQRACCRPI